mgnify:CR=1 FL=1
MRRDSFVESNKFNYAIARITVAFVWLYHGLVPKLLGPDADEMAMNMAAGFNNDQATKIAYLGGAGEILFGLVLLVFWKHRWPLVVSAFSMVALLVFVIAFQPNLTTAAFNPVTTNISVFALSILAYRMGKVSGTVASKDLEER